MAAQQDNLTKFLIDLSTDPDRAERFATNPGAEARRARLSNEERVAVFSGDASTLRTVFEADDNGTGIMTQQPLKRRKRKNGTGIMKKKKKRPAPKKKNKGSRKRARRK